MGRAECPLLAERGLVNKATRLVAVGLHMGSSMGTGAAPNVILDNSVRCGLDWRRECLPHAIERASIEPEFNKHGFENPPLGSVHRRYGALTGKSNRSRVLQ